MPPEILALIDKPHLLVMVLFFGAFVGMSVEQFLGKRRRAAWRRRNPGGWQKRTKGKVLPIETAEFNSAELRQGDILERKIVWLVPLPRHINTMPKLMAMITSLS